MIRCAALLLAALAACGGGTPSVVPNARNTLRLEGPTMGTSWHAAVVAEFGQEEQVLDLIAAALAKTDRLMSTWKPDSDVSNFSRAKVDEVLAVDPWTGQCLEIALKIASASDGAFDPTVAPMVRAWGFGAGALDSLSLAPSEEQLSRLRQQTGWQHVQISQGPQGDPLLRKLVPGLELDLSAIAKGFGADRAADALLAAGFHDFLLEVGGEIVLRGQRADGTAWQLGVERPQDNLQSGLELERRISLLGDGAMASSGDYRQFRIENGQRISHEIDPRSGHPIHNDVAAVTVIAPDCASADAWATAFMILGAPQGLKKCEALPGVEVLFLSREGNAQFKIQASSNFPTEN